MMAVHEQEEARFGLSALQPPPDLVHLPPLAADDSAPYPALTWFSSRAVLGLGGSF